MTAVKMRTAVLALCLASVAHAAVGSAATAGVPAADPAPGAKEAIVIIGTGKVAQALGPRLGALGHRVIYGSRRPQDADVRALVARSGAGASALPPAEAVGAGGVVILAVPWLAAEAAVRSLGPLEGKVLIDTTNPWGKDADQKPVELELPRSDAEFIQSWAPQAQVVKAFDTVNWLVMADPGVAGGPVSIPLAGDDPAAKARVGRLVTELGFEPADVGPLHNARLVEDLGMLYIRIKRQNVDTAYEFYLRLRPQVAPTPGGRKE